MKAEIFNYKKWINKTNSHEITSCLNTLLLQSDFVIINFVEHKFNNEGYTALWLIAESHLAVHTFPEENKSYIELSSCNKTKNKKFIELFEQKIAGLE